MGPSIVLILVLFYWSVKEKMLTNVMVYLSLGVPLVIAVPQLFFPPQVGKFYLGRLSKGTDIRNISL